MDLGRIRHERARERARLRLLNIRGNSLGRYFATRMIAERLAAGQQAETAECAKGQGCRIHWIKVAAVSTCTPCAN